MTLTQGLLLWLCLRGTMLMPVSHPDEIGLMLRHIELKKKTYIEKVFMGEPPDATEPLKGITLPVQNVTREILASACAIGVYLRDHLPLITEEFISDEFAEDVRLLEKQLQVIPLLLQGRHQNTSDVPDNCAPDYVNSMDLYESKKMGLRILHNVRVWMKGFRKMMQK